MRNILTPGARLVNTSSHLGHLSLINGKAKNSLHLQRIVRIVFGNQKMNEYEYQILLFGPNYSNSRIVRIIRSNTDLYCSVFGCEDAALQVLMYVCTLRRAGNVVNSIHPGTKHSKIQQQSVIPLEVRLNHIALSLFN